MEIKEVIVAEVVEVEYYSVRVDETKDLSNKEQLALFVRYYYQSDIKECCVGVFHLTALDADTLAQKINLEIESLGLSWKNCIAQCYDGASVMSGTFSEQESRKELYKQFTSTATHTDLT